MARKANDGRGRLGGRQKGTPNKSSSDLKMWLSNLLNNNRETIERDLLNLPPEERVRVLTSLFSYIIPKQASLTIEEQIASQTEALSRFLKEAPEEAIDEISKRVIELQKLNEGRNQNEQQG